MKNVTIYVAAGYMIAVRHGKYDDTTNMIEMINTDKPDEVQYRFHSNYKYTGHNVHEFYKSDAIFDILTGYKPDEAVIQYVIV